MPMHDLNCHHPKPRYSRRDYDTIAAQLNMTVREHTLEAVNLRAEERIMLEVVSRFCQLFLADNHLFDSARFYDAVYDLSHGAQT